MQNALVITLKYSLEIKGNDGSSPFFFFFCEEKHFLTFLFKSTFSTNVIGSLKGNH